MIGTTTATVRSAANPSARIGLRQYPQERLEAQLGGVVHQEGLVARQGLGAGRRAHLGQGVEVGPADRPLGPGRGGHRQMSERPAAAQLGPGLGLGQRAAGGQPGRRALGPLERPLPRDLKGLHAPAHHTLEAGQLALEVDDGAGVGQRRRIAPGQLVDGLAQGSQEFHG